MFFKKCSFTMLLAYLCALAAIMGCSSDSDEPEPEEIIAPEQNSEPSPPHWEDGTVTISIGRYKTARELYDAVQAAGMHIGDNVTEDLFRNGDFPLDGKKRSVEISVVSMVDIGMGMGRHRSALLDEVWTQFWEKGYRPLSIEESLELRRQFTNQPPVSTAHKMSAFFLLPRVEDSKNFGDPLEWTDERTYGIWKMFHRVVLDEEGNPIKKHLPMVLFGEDNPVDMRRFSAHVPNPLRIFDTDADKSSGGAVKRNVDWGREVLLGSHFACVKIH